MLLLQTDNLAIIHSLFQVIQPWLTMLRALMKSLLSIRKLPLLWQSQLRLKLDQIIDLELEPKHKGIVLGLEPRTCSIKGLKASLALLHCACLAL
jgi:hypothetical protein